MHSYKYGRFLKRLCLVLLLPGMLALTLTPAPVHANYFNDLYNGFQKFSELPGEVSQLQESYRQTVDELQETREELGSTLQEMETYRSENASLQEQNRQLAQVVEQLKEERQARENYLDKIKLTILTGLGLLIGYFVLIRLIRLVMRSRSGKADRLR